MFGAIYSASKTKKYLLKNTTIGNQLLFHFYQTPKIVPKIRTGGSFYLIVIIFEVPKQFQSWILSDFCSNDFSEISPAYLLFQWKPTPQSCKQVRFLPATAFVFNTCLRTPCQLNAHYISLY